MFETDSHHLASKPGTLEAHCVALEPLRCAIGSLAAFGCVTCVVAVELGGRSDMSQHVTKPSTRPIGGGSKDGLFMLPDPSSWVK